ncbi:hypothetical protein [Kineobactrum salinum]|uniref:Uncharacterized protein n=1 Tax=Kineobactrum salinum TaxID=2708301 RepID=A0A6C0U5T0_9GAMM|nr:hypothetical protein [Kineobactrum salinum]QIB67336.1 hypothetical protein G3T16_19995 [Kineobactrum salinum]
MNDSAYHIAMTLYITAALAALLITLWWLRHSWRPVWLCLLALGGAALLLTPAYPYQGVSTLAPALVVAAFQLLTAGVDAASHALRPLAVTLALAVVVTIVLRLSLWRRPGRARATAKPH